MTWLLQLYPREWRRRYGAEVEEVIASQPKSLQLFIDLLAGAVDARWKPQALAQQLDRATADPRGGSNMLTRIKGCGARASMSRKEALLSAALTIGAALVVAGTMLIGKSPVSETIGLVMFPGVLGVGTMTMYMRGHSPLAKVVLIGGPFVVLFLIGLVAGLLQSA